MPEEGLAVTLSPYRLNTLSPLAGVKSVNYLEHVIGWEEAHARDFHEAIVLNERGEVASATMANIFWVKHGTVHTPALATGALAGTTRARIIELAEELAVPLVEGPTTPDLATQTNLPHLRHARRRPRDPTIFTAHFSAGSSPASARGVSQ